MIQWFDGSRSHEISEATSPGSPSRPRACMAADEISTTEPPCQIEPTHLTIRVGKSIERKPDEGAVHAHPVSLSMRGVPG